MSNHIFTSILVLVMAALASVLYERISIVISDTHSAVTDYPGIVVTLYILIVILASSMCLNIYFYYRNKTIQKQKLQGLEQHTLNSLMAEAERNIRTLHSEKSRQLQMKETALIAKIDDTSSILAMQESINKNNAKAMALLSHAECQAANIAECLRIAEEDVQEAKLLRLELEKILKTPVETDKEKFTSLSLQLDMLEKRIHGTASATKDILAEEQP